MTSGMRVLLIVIAAGIMIAAWMNRIDAHAGAQGTAIITDRWTHNVYLCAMDMPRCLTIYPRPNYTPENSK
jgi:hypothetical protein